SAFSTVCASSGRTCRSVPPNRRKLTGGMAVAEQRPLGCGLFSEEEWAELVAGSGPDAQADAAGRRGRVPPGSHADGGRRRDRVPPGSHADGGRRRDRVPPGPDADAGRRRELLEHVRTCAACRAELAALARLSQQVRHVLAEADATLHDAVREAFVAG